MFVVNHDRMKPCHDRKMPAWIVKWQANPVVDEQPSKDDGSVYCLCRKACKGRFMIQCDYCDEWFHGSCVNLTSIDALHIGRYKCPGCKEISRGLRGQQAQK
jgi:hypothetical protein